MSDRSSAPVVTISGRAFDVSRLPSATVFVIPLARLAGWLIALLVVVASGVAGYRLSAGPEALERVFGDAPAGPVDLSFVDLPEVIVNLHAASHSRYLKIAVTLAVEPERRLPVERMQPQIMNALQEFLRGLDDRDLEGSAGLFRLRTELHRRLDLVLGEAVVADVLLRNILTQ
jgi:flagellar FliL protein